jgi:hypothetical protein
VIRGGFRALGVLLAAAMIAPAGAAARADTTWVQSALATQYELGSSLGSRNAPWVGTHNSFNSPAEMGLTLSSRDANQQIGLTDQLDQGIRSLELDLHWFPSAESGGLAPVVCHAAELHAGCSVEKPLAVVLPEITGWLRQPEHRDQVLLLYLEDHLDDETGYDTAASVVRDGLGDLLFAPPAGGGCTDLPGSLSRDQIRAAGAQVVIVSDCGIGAGWPSVAFSWSDHEEGQADAYTDYPTCGPDYTPSDYRHHLIRYYEDSTSLSAIAGDPGDRIDVPTAAAMARCGADLIGFDQLTAGDPRLAAMVWSWAPGEPAAGDCALDRVSAKRPFGRWVSRSCDRRRRPACRSRHLWLVLATSSPQASAESLCQKVGARFAAPRTGREAQSLRRAMQRAHAHGVWIDVQRGDTAWPG